MMNTESTKFLHQVSSFNKPNTVRAEFARMVAGHDLHWRGKDWSDAVHYATDPFWLYKTAECIGWWHEMKLDVESSYSRKRGCKTPRAIVIRGVAELANFYRGAWVAEVVAVGAFSDDLSCETHKVVFDLLDRLDVLHSTIKTRRVTTHELRTELLNICDLALAQYDRIICTLRVPGCDQLRSGVATRCEQIDAAIASIRIANKRISKETNHHDFEE